MQCVFLLHPTIVCETKSFETRRVLHSRRWKHTMQRLLTSATLLPCNMMATMPDKLQASAAKKGTYAKTWQVAHVKDLIVLEENDASGTCPPPPHLYRSPPLVVSCFVSISATSLKTSCESGTRGTCPSCPCLPFGPTLARKRRTPAPRTGSPRQGDSNLWDIKKEMFTFT